eukprot:TRINITY_DN70731_c0_g1_i1.p1 TRINITY_DN70731_c0_g1~~TRINITY_DN70731_c0_g1_i1.p1  ORF type:complete len:396 (-),score=46.51 TRINITY_DN70731_c0_g1_i1:95-1282(-)
MATSSEPWRFSRGEMRELLAKYERAVEQDAYNLLRPTPAERALMGDAMIQRRADAVRRAQDANRRFVEAVAEDLPDICSGPSGLDQDPHRPIAAFRQWPTGDAGGPPLPSSSYGTLASVFLHLLRDWSAMCEHVKTSTYEPAIKELRQLLPPRQGLSQAGVGPEVLLPGAGLGRLALELAAEGYRVEANDASRLFLTFADYLLNRPPDTAMPIFPLAHLFSENFAHEPQYAEVRVPSPRPGDVASARSSDARNAGVANCPIDESCHSRTPITLVAGDFVKTYGAGCVGHRRFDAIVTCFFIDTAVDIVELVKVMDSLLEEGGVWVNVGPLNWRKETRLKLCWEEVVQVWEGLGYHFVTQQRIDSDYHLPRGLKMYTEAYNCSLTAAVKGKPKASS